MDLIFFVYGDFLMILSRICQKACLFMMEVTRVRKQVRELSLKVQGQAKRQRRAWGHPYNRDQSKNIYFAI